MNKDLYNSTQGEIEFPKDKREHMKKCFHMVKGADENTEGFNRNKELQTQKFIDYKQLKRIKNFFDNFKGKTNEAPFVLNGGEKMKGWVDGALSFLRNSVYMTKHNKSETGMENQHIKNHEKDYTNVRPSQKHKSTLQKYDTAVTESLKRINNLMNR